jgi:hypothetical protein
MDQSVLALTLVKNVFKEAVDSHSINDITFLGQASEFYEFRPAWNVEIDICIFLDRINLYNGLKLFNVSNTIAVELSQLGFKYEMRCIDGPYKRIIRNANERWFVIHGAIFTKKTYPETYPILKWSWRKYCCIVDSNYLFKHSGSCPDIDELINGKRGIKERLEVLEKGNLILQETCLPTLKKRSIKVNKDSELFLEYCFSSAADVCRNHGRVLRILEADLLNNEEYFTFYYNSIFKCTAYKELMDLKNTIRKSDIQLNLDHILRLALNYLTSLVSFLNSGNKYGII